MLIVYKTIITILFLIFGFFVSDFENKKTKPLINQPWLGIMRFGYPLAPLCFFYFLIKTSKLVIWNYIAFLFMIIGTIIVIISKKTLGKRHSWTGYSSLDIDNFCTTGIYSWVRNPLYLGIIIAVVGTSGVVLPQENKNILFLTIYLLGTFLTFIFIIVSSFFEGKYLEEKFGEPYKKYVNQVFAFLPVRKYKG